MLYCRRRVTLPPLALVASTCFHEVPMRAHSRSFALATIALVLAACASSPQAGPRLITPACPQFQLRDGGNFTFDVTAAGDTVDLGDGSRLVFAPGAVTQDTRYWVRYLDWPTGQKLAGIDIERVSGHTGAFSEPVTLRLNYRRCNFTNSGRYYIMRFGPSGESPEGGSKSESGDWVEAMLGEFSGFAIAM